MKITNKSWKKNVKTFFFIIPHLGETALSSSIFRGSPPCLPPVELPNTYLTPNCMLVGNYSRTFSQRNHNPVI